MSRHSTAESGNGEAWKGEEGCGVGQDGVLWRSSTAESGNGEPWEGEEGGGVGQDGGVDTLQQSQVMVRSGRGRKVVVLGRMGE